MNSRSKRFLTAAVGICIAVILTLAYPAVRSSYHRAQSNACLNNLRQIGLAARLHASVNSDRFPTNFPSLRSWLSSPQYLVCPSSSAPRTEYWDTFNFSNTTYVMFGPGLDINTNYADVFVQCPFHGHLGLGDSSAQLPYCFYKPSRQRKTD